MNPLKLRLPIPASVDNTQTVPSPADIRGWLDTLPSHEPKNCLIQVAALVHRYNLYPMPSSQRFEAMQVLQPWVMRLLPGLQQKYHDQSLPLTPKLQALADEVFQLLDHMSQGYNQVIDDAVSDAEHDDLSPTLFQLALRQAIEQAGLLMLEAYAQYRSEPAGLWGELHRLYALAERNGLHNMALDASDAEGQPLTTIQYTYLRIVLLGLAQPYRLLAGQATILYKLLAKWTIGCRMMEKRDTLAEPGDCVVDLAGSRAPEMATSQTRFRPADGRFLDISSLRRQLAEISRRQVDNAQQTLAERMHQDLLIRLCDVWQGRGERRSERHPDGSETVMMGIGLGAAHHQISGEIEFNPEKTENEIHRPRKQAEDLSLLPKHEEERLFQEPGTRTREGLEATRVSRFATHGDVWDAVHDTQLHARVLRESAMAGYAIEPWLRINHSTGGVALRRMDDNRSQARVGVLTAWRLENELNLWHVGSVRWMQINRQGQLELGIRSLGSRMAAVAVRAIGGTGSGGEYFRSLLIDLEAVDGKPAKGLLVPVSIYDTDTQLVLNLTTELKYVRLTRLIETTSSYSLFAFSLIEMPPQEKARVQSLPDAD